MTAQASATTTGSPYRSAGWAAVLSGVIGIMAFGFLITAVMTRTEMALSRPIYLMFRAHDIAVVLQFLLMIPVAFALHKLSQGMSRATLAVGIGTLSFTVLLLLLAFVGIIADALYMFPQGIFGVWLIFVCWSMHGTLSRGLRWLGMLVGFGLMLVGTFPVGYIIFVDTLILQIPAVDAANYPDPDENTANQILHFILAIGSFMGVITLPFWTILLGRRLLREGSFQPDAEKIDLLM